MHNVPFAVEAPIHISNVGLRARDPERLAAFYTENLGLEEISAKGGSVMLGVGNRKLLEISGKPGLSPDDPRQAGLFHTAFLLRERTDLARWALFARSKGLRLEGASDHLVSEAIYLSDPEGNGIEIYVDRPPQDWKKNESGIAMATQPLDFADLLATIGEDDAGWQGAPEKTVIGHVHLRVGDPQTAESWWRRTLGFETMARYGSQAVFLATGGYHHHIGANNWRSAGAGPRDPKMSGLAFVELADRAATKATEHIDPWGTVIRVRPA